MSQAINTLQNNQNERLSAIIENYDTLSSKLASQNSEFAEKLTTQINEEYAKVQQHSTDSLQQMVDLKDAYREVNEQMLSSTTEMNQTLTTELRSSLTSFIANLQNSVATEVDTLRKAIADNVESLQASYAYINDHVANIKGNYESAAQSYQDAVVNANRLNESQENVLSTIDDSMKHVIKTNEKVDEAISIIVERQERIENLISHINDISTTIEVLQKLESQLNRIANR